MRKLSFILLAAIALLSLSEVTQAQPTPFELDIAHEIGGCDYNGDHSAVRTGPASAKVQVFFSCHDIPFMVEFTYVLINGEVRLHATSDWFAMGHLENPPPPPSIPQEYDDFYYYGIIID